MHTLFGSFLPTVPLPSPFPFCPPSVTGRSSSAYITNFVKKRHKPKKEDKVFLLLELRIARQKYS
jgi:hypothetical protein